MTVIPHIAAETTDAERRRSRAITRLGVLEEICGPPLTALTRIACALTGAASAAVHIVDEDYQHRVAATNAALGRHPRIDAMCGTVVELGHAVFCADASEDERFAHTSFTHGPAPVRFYAAVPLRTSDDVVIGTLCAFDQHAFDLDPLRRQAFEDLAAQAIAQIELRRIALDLGHAASRDPLTGLFNRFALSDRLDHALTRRARHGTDVLAIVADVDDFKPINDLHGHAAGDRVLAKIAQRLARTARMEDTVARVGGDEFVVIAEVGVGCDPVTIVARLRDALDGPVQVDGHELNVCVSLGWAVSGSGEVQKADLLAEADAALYEGKQRFRQSPRD